MVMNWQDAALAMAGVIGNCVAVAHGILTQRLMVRTIEAFLLTDKRTAASIRRLVPVLLQFSTFNWFLGGLALIAAAIGSSRTQDWPQVCSSAVPTCLALSATFGGRVAVILAGCSMQSRSF